MSANERVDIRPDTKVGALLEDWPELEETLVAGSPAFRKLSNPVLRRTVARVATLASAAKMGGVSVTALVASLREAAGLEPIESADDSGSDEDDDFAGTVVETIDVDALLEAGAHPLGTVRKRVAALHEGEAIRLLSSFRPEPLIEALRAEGRRVRTRDLEGGRSETLVG